VKLLQLLLDLLTQLILVRPTGIRTVNLWISKQHFTTMLSGTWKTFANSLIFRLKNGTFYWF
jgi:hypothetical protein